MSKYRTLKELPLLPAGSIGVENVGPNGGRRVTFARADGTMSFNVRKQVVDQSPDFFQLIDEARCRFRIGQLVTRTDNRTMPFPDGFFLARIVAIDGRNCQLGSIKSAHPWVATVHETQLAEVSRPPQLSMWLEFSRAEGASSIYTAFRPPSEGELYAFEQLDRSWRLVTASRLEAVDRRGRDPQWVVRVTSDSRWRLGVQRVRFGEAGGVIMGFNWDHANPDVAHAKPLARVKSDAGVEVLVSLDRLVPEDDPRQTTPQAMRQADADALAESWLRLLFTGEPSDAGEDPERDAESFLAFLRDLSAQAVDKSPEHKSPEHKKLAGKCRKCTLHPNAQGCEHPAYE